MDLKEEEILGDHIAEHWYYRAKAAAMLAALAGPADPGEGPQRSAIDIGAGSGFFARRLLEAGAVEQVDCVDTSYEEDTDEIVGDGRMLRRRRRLTDALDQADLALLMDVLEHVEDDLALLGDTVARLRPGGRVFVTVPAFSWLWSNHDVFLGHHRRYTLAQVESLFAAADLDVDRGHYYFGAVLPAAAAQRLLDRVRPNTDPGSKLKRHAPATNRLLTALSLAEIKRQHRNRLAGLSVMVLGHRR